MISRYRHCVLTFAECLPCVGLHCGPRRDTGRHSPQEARRRIQGPRLHPRLRARPRQGQDPHRCAQGRLSRMLPPFVCASVACCTCTRHSRASQFLESQNIMDYSLLLGVHTLTEADLKADPRRPDMPPTPRSSVAQRPTMYVPPPSPVFSHSRAAPTAPSSRTTGAVCGVQTRRTSTRM